MFYESSYSTEAEDPFSLLSSEEFRKRLETGKYSNWFLNMDPKAIYCLAKGISLLGKEPDSTLVAWATKDAPAETVFLTPTQKQALKMLMCETYAFDNVEEDESLLPLLGSFRKLYGVIWEAGGFRVRVSEQHIERGDITMHTNDRALWCLSTLVKYAAGAEAYFQVGGASYRFDEPPDPKRAQPGNPVV
eukprot:CAMPEP_0202895828 /NCGR_PEP_ID=MMETSP1392-20130828/4952_1 /ASSEMBLY_ACC=CAM_ASM_000868 /TAXON_ID=225041 /ORGANISM="Chlamydomonas chlamydogama, Strain SAG 11-48b" /LENGTH=189 /DNA_ID=CAMNT_0049580971 /DNA_START=40 /DNA_END=609 /DNA_ORIENTATION=-